MTSTSAVKPLTMLDTNVLVDALYEDLPEYPAASHLLTLADNTNATFCIAPQVLAEFYAIITDPRRVSAPYTAAEARQEVEKIRHKRGIRILPVPVDVVDRWLELLQAHPVTRARVFDLQLVATMLGNEVRSIYTFNVRDFTPFSELEVLTPTVP
jgi:predicted nucleic acid-binding protein